MICHPLFWSASPADFLRVEPPAEYPPALCKRLAKFSATNLHTPKFGSAVCTPSFLHQYNLPTFDSQPAASSHPSVQGGRLSQMEGFPQLDRMVTLEWTFFLFVCMQTFNTLNHIETLWFISTDSLWRHIYLMVKPIACNFAVRPASFES